MTEAEPIVKVLQHYFPHWEPPTNRKEWNPCLCPSHVEERPSCSVNLDAGAVKCQACGFKGDIISIIKQQEGVNYAEALQRAEEISGGSYHPVQGKPSRKPSRRVFGESGTGTGQRSNGGRQVSSGIRSRTSPWS